MSLGKNMLYYVYFGELLVAQDAAFGVKLQFWINLSFGETEKSDPSTEIISTAQYSSAVIAFQWSFLKKRLYKKSTFFLVLYFGSIESLELVYFSDEYTIMFFSFFSYPLRYISILP